MTQNQQRNVLSRRARQDHEITEVLYGMDADSKTVGAVCKGRGDKTYDAEKKVGLYRTSSIAAECFKMLWR